MFNWLKKSKIEYPDYWNTYAALFEEEDINTPIKNWTFTVLDTETTGFNYYEDRMLCIGAIKIKAGIINLQTVFEKYIQQDTFNPQTVEIHGIMRNQQFESISEKEALIQFLEYVENSVIVAHHAVFDITMINRALERHSLPNLLNRTLDTGYLFKKTKAINSLLKNDRNFSLDDVCNELNISIKDRHTAAGDAMLTALAFLKITARLNFKQDSPLKALIRR